VTLNIGIAKDEDISEIMGLAKKLFPKCTIHRKTEDIFVKAEDGTMLIGFAHLSEVKGRTVIQGIGVAKEFQNQGVGSALLEYVLMLLRDEKEIYLRVREDNAQALLLYAKHGFFLKKSNGLAVLCKAKPT
jgi:ribosomal protein S18 acetylase RimI-like enzyme